MRFFQTPNNIDRENIALLADALTLLTSSLSNNWEKYFNAITADHIIKELSLAGDHLDKVGGQLKYFSDIHSAAADRSA